MIQDVTRHANLEEASDEAVLKAALRDPEAYVILVRRYEDAFMRKALSILRVQEDAEEVVQDTFTRIYLYGGRFSPQEGASFSSWGYAILTRQCFTRYQKQKRDRARRTELEPDAYERLPDTQSFEEDLTIRNEVLMALSRIPDAAARVLRMQFLEGKSQEEIALSEGQSISAVKTRVHRAKKLFKNELS